MPEYKVIEPFKDLQDNDHIYWVGDIYPREGKEVTQERIDELSSANNLIGKVLIEPVYTIQGKPFEKLTAEQLKDVTKDDIKARLDELGIDYKSSDTKDQLVERLHGKVGGN